MSRWEVRTRSGAIVVEGANWLLALGAALPALDLEPDVMARLVCDVQPDGVVRIMDPISRTPMLVRRMKEDQRVDGARTIVPVGVVAVGGAAGSSGDAEPDEPSEEGPRPTEPETEEVSRVPAPALHMPRRPVEAAPEPPPPPPVVPHPPDFHPDAPDVPHTEEADFTPAHLRTLDDSEPLLDDESEELPSGPPADLEEELFTLGMDVADAPSIEFAAEHTLRILERFVPAESASVLVCGTNDNALRFVAAHGPTADRVKALTIPLGTGLAGFCHENGVSLIVRNASRDPRHLHQVDEQTGYRTGDMLTVPLKDRRGDVYGCIQLLNPPAGFAHWHLDAAASMASTLADYIVAAG